MACLQGVLICASLVSVVSSYHVRPPVLAEHNITRLNVELRNTSNHTSKELVSHLTTLCVNLTDIAVSMPEGPTDTKAVLTKIAESVCQGLRNITTKKNLTEEERVHKLNELMDKRKVYVKRLEEAMRRIAERAVREQQVPSIIVTQIRAGHTANDNQDTLHSIHQAVELLTNPVLFQQVPATPIAGVRLAMHGSRYGVGAVR